MVTYIESKYQFDFNEEWEVIKYDEHRFYKILSGHNMSGVDFAAIYKKETVYLIEVKNYRQYNRKTEEKSLDQFIEEIIEKGRDSIQLITVIYKYLNRKWLYRTFISIILKFPWLQPEWRFWSELYRISCIDRKGKFLLWIDADYDIEKVRIGVTEALSTLYQQVEVHHILDSTKPVGINITKL